MAYVLALDIGIASVGLSGVDYPNEDILFCNSHVFDAAENPKNGASLALPRREKRGQRRVIRRRAGRKKAVRRLLSQHGLRDIDVIDASKSSNVLCVWELRKEALERLLNDAEFVRVLFHIAKHRGFQSNRKDQSERNDIEGMKVLTGAKELEEAMIRSGRETVGAYISTLDKKRNGDGDYSRMVTRDLLHSEVKYIFDAQRKYKNDKATQELEHEYAAIAFTQKPLRSSAWMVGDCTLEPAEKRAPKHSYTAELFVLWSKLNNLKIRTTGKGERFLTPDEKNKITALVHAHKTGVTYTRLRNTLSLEEAERFNIGYRKTKKEQDSWEKIRKATEAGKFFVLDGYQTLKEVLADSDIDWQNRLQNKREQLDEAARILSFYEDEKEIRDLLSQAGFSEKEQDRLLKITGFSKTVDLSLKAIRKILPHMMQGLTYDKACDKAGYDPHGAAGGQKGDKLPPFEDIRNPVVNRALAQSRKIINACIRTYGMPETIILEFGRDIGKSKQDRDKIERTIKQNEAHREEAKKHFIELTGQAEARGGDILKYRLWQEQDHTCPYCGVCISGDEFKDPLATQIDHILPYSRTFDDSYMNKVLCHMQCNQDKGNRTPFEWLGQKAIWDKVEALSAHLPKPKADRFVMEVLDEEGFKERNLNDTRYIARLLKSLLEKHLDMGEGNRIQTRNGRLTAHLRRMWGLQKSRDTDRHHALDAIVLACSTQSHVQRLSNWNRYEAKKGKAEPYAPKPWDTFREDALEAVSQIFVSRLPVRKVTGAAHEDTIRSQRANGEIVQRVKLAGLKPDMLERLVDKERNTALYTVLKERLDAHGGKPEKAFVEPVYMPCKDPGKQGPKINAVRIVTKEKSGIPINEGIASNGGMVRTDVFEKGGKYYLCPVYVHQIRKGKGALPNKVITGKEEKDWTVIDDSYRFLFSMHKNDLIRVVKKDGTNAFGYYRTTDRSGGTIKICAHDNDSSFGNKGLMKIGVQNLKSFEKYTVDYFGNKSRVRKEERNGMAYAADSESGQTLAVE